MLRATGEWPWYSLQQSPVHPHGWTVPGMRCCPHLRRSHPGKETVPTLVTCVPAISPASALTGEAPFNFFRMAAQKSRNFSPVDTRVTLLNGDCACGLCKKHLMQSHHHVLFNNINERSAHNAVCVPCLCSRYTHPGVAGPCVITARTEVDHLIECETIAFARNNPQQSIPYSIAEVRKGTAVAARMNLVMETSTGRRLQSDSTPVVVPARNQPDGRWTYPGAMMTRTRISMPT